MEDILFAGLTPQKYIWVSPTGSDSGTGSESDPLRTIQAAVNKATAGTAIMVTEGVYYENVKLPTNSAGTADNPIWLMSADGPQAAKVVAVDQTVSTIYGFGTDNYVVSGFEIEGGFRGIQFSQSGRDFSNMVSNVVVEGNVIHDTKEDGIKIGQADNAYVVGNTIYNVVEEGIDFLAVNNGVIAYNEVSNAKSTAAGIFAKGGSTGVLIENNYVHDIPFGDGICIGGQTETQFFRPGFTTYEAKNVLVTGNLVEDVARRPVNVKGALDSQIIDNYLVGNPEYYAAIAIQMGSSSAIPPMYSANIEIADNILVGNQKIYINTGNNNGISIHDNVPTGQWTTPVGPDAYLDAQPQPPANAAPVIVSATATGSATEWADNSANEVANTTHTASGSVVYSDANAQDLHTASVVPKGPGYLGTFSLNNSAIDSNDTVGWSFAVSDSAIGNLSAGETKTQLYDITINDGHGGTVTQTVTITITGASDTVATPNSAPVIVSATATGAATEWVDNSASETANTAHTASGSIVYSDANASDLHTASFAPKGLGYLGTFSLNTSAIDTSDTVGWSFTVSDSAMGYLNVGETKTQAYDVTISDGQGGAVTKTVTITLTGAADTVAATNSAPVIVSATTTGTATEWADKSANETANAAHTASGAVSYSDANALDLHTASVTAKGTGYLGAFSLDTASIDSADSLSWLFTIADSAMESMKAGRTKVQSYDVTISDGHGGTVTQTITITLVGADDTGGSSVRAPRALRGNDPNNAQDLGWSGDASDTGHHGRYDGGGDFATLLGANLHSNDFLHG